MPIKIPNSLPAASVLTSEQVFVMTEDRAVHQDIRPLELLFLNLMPKKITTEIQYMRKLSNSALQVNIDLLRVDQHIPRNTPQSHLDTFYKDFDEVRDKYYDGMIITGAPLDQVSFEEVTYWDKLQEMIKWSAEHVTSTLFSCWGVAAALNVFYGLPMINRREKLSGIYLHNRAHCTDPLIRGFDDVFYAPQSRFIDFPTNVIEDETDLHILADSPEAGVFLAVSPDGRQIYVTGHPEYDVITLAEEYRRDLNAGKNPKIPCNYFPHDDPNLAPPCTWRSHASLLFGNWLNYYVYQVTPFNFEHRVPEREMLVR
ncbi:MAG: homoserine O-succinyltransferase [Proteobacteria bacterium]|uniref:Homoserine O-acetyltransferase n=1 Tax=Candidatus Avisuccinivibrio stercorigallinarum TaxID=2840704 RepID=A0A9D9DAR9_9GAMM|nr:homoserine O-succinyltransferase [Candidatus Avisuccinivibrio stercorigallinarum]